MKFSVGIIKCRRIAVEERQGLAREEALQVTSRRSRQRQRTSGGRRREGPQLGGAALCGEGVSLMKEREEEKDAKEEKETTARMVGVEEATER